MYDVLVIGAGPSGAIAATLLAQKGYRVLVLERDLFPRFSIGESLLPHCMEFINEAGMSGAVKKGGFQKKNGAVFQHNGRYSTFDFRKKFSKGPGETFQVERADFDKILADEAAKAGAEVRYQHTVINIDVDLEHPRVVCKAPSRSTQTFEARFILDASGFGRVLPRLLSLERPSNFPIRSSLFCHIDDGIRDSSVFDREKILITVHPRQRDVWFWLIPFSSGRSSIGVVAKPEFLELYSENLDICLRELVTQDSELSKLLPNATWDTPVRRMSGYSSDVSTLATDKFALLGNAGEFLDPVFSSGVTIALHSAGLAATVLDQHLKGKSVDWNRDYSEPLRKGVDTFREFVTAWYDGRFQDIIFYENGSTKIKSMITSILAGYAWDTSNPYVSSPKKRLDALWRFCS